MRNYFTVAKQRYESIREYLAELWAYVDEDDPRYSAKEIRRLEELVEKARNKALVESIQKSLER